MKTRKEHRKKAQALITKILQFDNFENAKLCPGLPQRVAVLMEALFESGALTEHPTIDTPITETRDTVYIRMLLRAGKYGRYECEENDCRCVDLVNNAINNVDLTPWDKDWYSGWVCSRCFKDRTFKFSYDCKLHEQERLSDYLC